MARRSLTSLIEQSAEPNKPSPTQPEPSDAKVITKSVSTKQPKYLTFVRKEARLTEQQYAELTELARRLSRAASAAGQERITENTLIRVAVDYLLTQSCHLTTTTERDLLTNLKWAPNDTTS